MNKKNLCQKYSAYIKYSKSFEEVNPRIAYVIKNFAVQNLFKEFQTNQSAFTMSKAELVQYVKEIKEEKEKLGEGANVSKDEFNQFLLGVFENVDENDREGEITMKTAGNFRLVGDLIDVFVYFDSIPEDWKKKQKYCKFKCVDIVKSLKAGEQPRRGGPKETQDDDLNNELKALENENKNVTNQPCSGQPVEKVIEAANPHTGEKVNLVINKNSNQQSNNDFKQTLSEHPNYNQQTGKNQNTPGQPREGHPSEQKINPSNFPNTAYQQNYPQSFNDQNNPSQINTQNFPNSYNQQNFKQSINIPNYPSQITPPKFDQQNQSSSEPQENINLRQPQTVHKHSFDLPMEHPQGLSNSGSDEIEKRHNPLSTTVISNHSKLVQKEEAEDLSQQFPKLTIRDTQTNMQDFYLSRQGITGPPNVNPIVINLIRPPNVRMPVAKDNKSDYDKVVKTALQHIEYAGLEVDYQKLNLSIDHIEMALYYLKNIKS